MNTVGYTYLQWSDNTKSQGHSDMIIWSLRTKLSISISAQKIQEQLLDDPHFLLPSKEVMVQIPRGVYFGIHVRLPHRFKQNFTFPCNTQDHYVSRKVRYSLIPGASFTLWSALHGVPRTALWMKCCSLNIISVVSGGQVIAMTLSHSEADFLSFSIYSSGWQA